jgi:toxoflavin biosynthesis protein ToxC
MISHTGPIAGIASYGEWIATAGYDNRLILWSEKTKAAVAMGMHDHLVNSCAFSHDGKYLVSASSDYSARIWAVPSMRLLGVLSDHQDDVDMAVFSPDDQLIATCALDRVVRIYNRQGNCLNEFKGHTGNVLALSWTAHGKEVVSTSVDGTIRRWGVTSGDQLSCSELNVRTDSLEIRTDGVIYAADDLGQIVIINKQKITKYQAHQAGIKKVVLQENLNQLVCLSYDGFMSVWDISNESPVEIGRSKLPSCIWARGAAMTDNRKIVAATFGSTYASFDSNSQTWELDDVKAGNAINAAHQSQGHLFTIGDAGELHRDGQLINCVGSLCNFLTSHGNLLITGGQLGELFNALTGEVLYKHYSPLNCAVTFERSGSPHLIIGTYTGELLVFSISNGKTELVKTLKIYENAVKGISIARDQIFSVCANTEIAWHDVETLSQRRTLAKAHDKIVNDCCMIDDEHFATISRDRTLKIWNGKGHESYTSPHPNSVKCISINEQKDKLATGSYGGTVAIFDLKSRAWKKFGRPTTAGISDLIWDEQQHVFIASSYDGNIYRISEN